MIKVLQIIPSFGVGGAEKVVLNYLKYNNESSMHIKAVSLYPRQGSIYDEEISDKKYDVEYLNKKRGFDLAVVHELRLLIRKYQRDVIHTHLYALKYLVLTGEIRGRKIFHTIHNQPEKDVGKMDVLLNKYFFQKNIVIPIALQGKLAESVNTFYNVQTTKIIHNGIPLSDFKTPQKTSILAKMNIDSETYIIGHVGRMSKQKNHTFIIKVFQKLNTEMQNSILLLVGTGEDEDKIYNMVKEMHLTDRVLFLGNRSDIPELFNLMDVFFFPSLYEGLGIVLVEAQAAGVPCVVSEQIPDEVILTPHIQKLSLNAPMEDWVYKLMHPETIYNNCIYEELGNYDIHKTMCDLELLYSE